MIKQFSNPGKHHCFDKLKNQDAISVAKNKRYIAISLADGVSTCSESKTGAFVACEAINTLLEKKAYFFFQFSTDQIADITISHILYELNKHSVNDGVRLEEYSSTIASALIDTKLKRAVLINLGDGIIIGTSKGTVNVLSAPDDSTMGCCVTTTQNAINSINVRKVDIETIDSLTICSDGAWKEMFIKNRIKPEISNHLLKHEYEMIGEFLTKQDCFDDYSFVSVELETRYWRKTA